MLLCWIPREVSQADVPRQADALWVARRCQLIYRFCSPVRTAERAALPGHIEAWGGRKIGSTPPVLI